MTDLGIDTTGWIRGCGHSGCRWLTDPEYVTEGCPDHSDPPMVMGETDEEIAEAKRRALAEQERRA